MKGWRCREKLVLATIILSCGLAAHSEPAPRAAKSAHRGTARVHQAAGPDAPRVAAQRLAALAAADLGAPDPAAPARSSVPAADPSRLP